jgi:hypothetical protein
VVSELPQSLRNRKKNGGGGGVELGGVYFAYPQNMRAELIGRAHKSGSPLLQHRV